MNVETLTPDAEETSMRDLGHEADVAQGREQSEAPPETPIERPTSTEDTPETEPPPQAPVPEPETPESPELPEPKRDAPQQVPRERDPVTGKFQQRDGKPDTEYSKAVKEKERQDRSWSALQAEKEQFRQMASQWEEQQRMAQLEAQRAQYQPLKKDGLTAKEYFDGAQVFEREGDFENALKAYKVASDMGREEQGRYQEFERANKEYEWRKQMEEVTKVAPQIWDGNTPIHQHLARIINQNPKIYDLPNGFRLAAEAAYLITREGLLKEREDEIVALKAENEKLRRKSQPARGGFASPRTSDKDFDDMSVEEMEQHLKGVTAEADGYR